MLYEVVYQTYKWYNYGQVLILIFLEYALREEIAEWKGTSKELVLILIFLEYALRVGGYYGIINGEFES